MLFPLKIKYKGKVATCIMKDTTCHEQFSFTAVENMNNTNSHQITLRV